MQRYISGRTFDSLRVHHYSLTKSGKYHETTGESDPAWYGLFGLKQPILGCSVLRVFYGSKTVNSASAREVA